MPAQAKTKVIILFPPYDGEPLSAPFCLLALASPLLQAGFEVVLVDAAARRDWEQVVLANVDDAVCLGISLLTGPMIHGAIRVARAAKRRCPQLPVVFGGWHPSLTVEQTLREPYVDAVIRGQGELTFVEAVQRFSAGESLAGVRGVSWKDGGRMVHELERPVASLNDLPAPAYHLADYDVYHRICGVRKLSYASSVGCPYACHYCTDQVFYKRRFNAYTAQRVVSDLLELDGRYRFDQVSLLDSNYLVDLKRANAISRGLLDARVAFRWSFQASTDFVARMSDDDMRLLGAAGCNHIGFGTESASQEVLALMNKKHERVQDMYETARKTELAGIHTVFNVILGYPGETEADRQQTFRIMSDIARKHWNVSFSPNIFTPYPGIPIWPQLRELGVRYPETLEEWASLPLGANILPWLQGEELRRLRRQLEFFLLNNHIRKAVKRAAWMRRGFRRALGAPLRWRIRHNVYSFPWELWLARTTERVVTRRSLLTGQPLAHDMDEVCAEAHS